MFLFTLMSNKKVFLPTATLIEDILSVRKVKANAYTLLFKSLESIKNVRNYFIQQGCIKLVKNDVL